jgi:hypothetical protein|tara:strand:+ start:7277 stop:7903 length:627 start_codon:yes stop_codon:yes gene_type:complete
MKKVTKKLQKFIDSISEIGDSNIPDDGDKIYYSEVDGSYLTRVGMENDLNFLLKNGITEQIQNWNNEKGNPSNIGFNPIEQKWYGWSHRAIFGFGIDSECKKGNLGYSAGNKIDFAEENLRWYGDTDMDETYDDTYKINATVKEHTEDGVLGVLVEYEYDNTVPNKAMRGKTSLNFEPYPETWGKGEWTAKTLEEAKVMAIDFSKGVS